MNFQPPSATICNAAPSRAALLLLAIVVCAAGQGCAGWTVKNPLPIAPDVNEKQQERRKLVLEEYEQKRTAALLNAARTRLQQGDDRGAQLAVEQLLKQSPDNAEARLLRAELLLMHGRLPEAKAELEAVLAKAPDNAAALHALGLVYEAMGDAEQAAEYFGRAAELDPENPLVSLEYESTIDPRYIAPGAKPETGEMQPAGNGSPSPRTGTAPLFAQLARQPQSAAALREADRALVQRQPEAATAHLIRAMEIEADHVDLPQRAALCALQSRQPAVAIGLLEAALLKYDGSADLYRLYGLALTCQQRHLEAERAFRNAIALDNRDALAYFLLGQTLARLGRSEESQKFASEAIRLDATLAGKR